MLFGFQDDGQLKAGNYDRLDAGKAMGGQVLRVIMSREETQRPKGAYDFSKYDAIINQARAKGLEVQMVLDNRQGFKRGSGDVKKYQQYAHAAGVHFKGRVARWSLGNEPDLKMNPKKYRNLYAHGYEGLRKADEHAKILFGEVSAHGGMDYAYKALTAGKKQLQASGFAIHPYQRSDPLAPPKAGEPAKWGIGRTGQMQKLLKQFHGNQGFSTRDGHTPGLYFTEFGYDTRPDSGVTDQQAATYWPRALKKAKKAAVRELIAYSLSGDQPGSKWDTGLLNYDGTPRPVYGAVAAARTGR